MSNPIVSQNVNAPSFRLAPPPVRPFDQETEFADGDALLIELDGQRHTVVVARVSVRRYTVRPDRTVRSVLYVIRYYDAGGDFLLKSQVLGEKALVKAFRGFIWWLK